MTKANSMLAAIHAAANLTTSLTAPAAAPQPPQEPSMTTSTSPSIATLAVYATPAALAAAYPEHCAALRSEGATAERSRLAGIDEHAMPGHENLIAEMKADGSVTPDMAAARILKAEKTLRGQQLQGIKDVETDTGKVQATASTAPSAAAPSGEKATTPDGWKTEFAASAALQSEFASVDDYLAVRKAEASGKVKVLGTRAAK